MTTGRRSLLIALLILSTALWGAAVAGHTHAEPAPHLCDICLLPHVADVADSVPLPAPPADYSTTSPAPCERLESLTHLCYHSRAPPA